MRLTVYGHDFAPVHKHGREAEDLCLSFLACTSPCLLRYSMLFAWNSLKGLVWLAGASQGSTCFCLSFNWKTSKYFWIDGLVFNSTYCPCRRSKFGSPC